MKSSRYYFGSYKRAVEKKLSTEFLFYYKIKCSLGRTKLFFESYISQIHKATGIPKSTIVRNVQKLVDCGFIELKDDVRGRDYYEIVSPQRLCTLLHYKVLYFETKKNKYSNGFLPLRWQYGFITINNTKKSELIANILTLEYKWNKHKQDFVIKKKARYKAEVGNQTLNLIRGELPPKKGIYYDAPADIIISNKTSAFLLGYKSQGHANRIVRSLLSFNLASSIDTPAIKLVAKQIPRYVFESHYNPRSYFFNEKTLKVYTRECSHIYLT